ncbi:MAG: flagellar brake protein [Pseudobdellovibrio sp.]
MSTKNQNDKNTVSSFYNPVDEQAYRKLLTHLKEKNLEVIFKIFDIYGKSNFVNIENTDLAIFKKFPYSYEKTSIFCFFKEDETFYFFRSHIISSDQYYIIKYPEKIYKVQRRDDYRFSIPAYLDYDAKIIEHPDLSCKLINISLGGCRIIASTQEEIKINIESDVSIFIRLLEFGGITLPATVVFSQYKSEEQEQIFGLKFKSLESEQISQLHNTLIHVDRIARKKE